MSSGPAQLDAAGRLRHLVTLDDLPRNLIEKLLARADVLAENFRPGALERQGLDYASLSALHPALVYVSISGFGHLAPTPYATRPAYAPIAEAMAGLYEPLRKPGEPPPVVVAGALGDNASALYAVLETDIVPAFYDRDASGVPRRWLAVVKESIRSVLPSFSARRMVKEYAERMYAPALSRRVTVP